MNLTNRAQYVVFVDDDIERVRLLSVETELMKGWLRRQEGQTTTEWLMVAGVLTGVAILFLNLFPTTLRSVLRAVGIALRTTAP